MDDRRIDFDLICVWICNKWQVFERFGYKLGKTRLPQLAVADFSRGAGLEVYRDTQPSAHKRPAELTAGGSKQAAQRIVAFVEAFDKGDLPLFVRSQLLPARRPMQMPLYPNGRVQPVVGDNFNAAALNKHYASLLFAFMPGPTRLFSPYPLPLPPPLPPSLLSIADTPIETLMCDVM